MTKKGSYSVSRTKSMNTKTNKSLNEIYRKKQMQSIELENKRFLMRLQGKRPTVNTLKLRRDWEDNKSVIKRMANCEFNMTQFKSKDSRIRSMTSERLFRQKFDDAKISKFRVIDGHKMLIKIEFSDGYLKIVGDSRDHKDLKVIEIPKEEAVLFIEKDC
jgi:ATP adenylyltransferase/5',5'''-P-1,P-4-tetraphosphate phosphorylase II